MGNERLQQIFIDLTVRGEQKEYHNEGLKWKDIPFFDNKIVCELIEGKNPPGIMRCLDDTCRAVHAVDSGTADAKFLERVAKTIPTHPHMNISNGQFTIKHYAGNVTYSIDEFVFKNQDPLYISLVEGMQASSMPFLVQLFPEDLKDNKKSPTTSGFKIRESAGYLVKRLSSCTPSYIRCIKSNDKKEPLGFNSSRVEHQVKYLGLAENVRVKRAGYAYRHFKNVFLRRFGEICTPPAQDIPSFLNYMRQHHSGEVDVSEFTEGRSKIFIREAETIYMLEELLFKKQDPEGYKLKLKEFERAQKEAEKIGGKHTTKNKCLLQ